MKLPQWLITGMVTMMLAGCGEQSASAPPANVAVNPNAKRLALVQLSDVGITEGADKDILQGLAESGMTEGTDFTIMRMSAQSDLPTLMSLVDNAVMQGADLIIPLQPQTLQACLTRKVTLPTVFHLAAAPFRLGAGTTDTDHAANLTGSYMLDPLVAFDTFCAMLRAANPQLTRLATLCDPGSIPSSSYVESLTAAAARRGFTVASVPVTEPIALLPAVAALLDRKPEAIVLVPFTALDDNPELLIKRAAEQGIPCIGTIEYHARCGAPLTIGVDCHEGGVLAGKMIARILRGENPQDIPFHEMGTLLYYQDDARAQACGLALPAQYAPLRRQLNP